MKISIISSSTRKGRLSHRIALALKASIEKQGQDADIIDLNEVGLPPFNERLPYLDPQPELLVEIMEKLTSSHGIIFLTPEYNGSISSGLKNFIDVFAKKGFMGKPIGVATGSTGAMGGIRAAYQLQQIILSIYGYPQPRMLTVGKMDKVLDQNGNVSDPDFGEKLDAYVHTFIDFSSRINRIGM
jgi:NAD(P)H-dependent FMN reductase